MYQVIQNSFSVGKEYSFQQMVEIAKVGKYRYEEEILPGYKDEENKIGLQKYGDLYVWYQLLDYASSHQKNFILVTNDAKNDWFEEDKITPRYELLKEFNGQANKSIWLLSMKNFLWKINGLLDERLNEQIFKDIDLVDENKDNNVQTPSLLLEMIQDAFHNVLAEDVFLIDAIPTDETIRLLIIRICLKRKMNWDKSIG